MSLATPHANGALTLGSDRVDIGPHQSEVELELSANEAHRGLSRLDIFWQGAEPLVVEGVELSVDTAGPG